MLSPVTIILQNAPLSRLGHNIQVLGVAALEALDVPASEVTIKEDIATTAGTPSGSASHGPPQEEKWGLLEPLKG